MKKWRISGVIIIAVGVISIPLLFLTLCTVTGEGITFESVSACVGTKRALSAMEAGDYHESARHIDFWGFSEDRTSINSANIESERQRYIEGLEDFFDTDMTMRGYEVINAVTDDGYTTVTTRIMLDTNEDTHSFILRLSKQNGRLCPMGVVVEASDEATAVVADAFINVVRTHYPG